MKLAITHTTRVSYPSPVMDGVMVTRLGPLSDVDQRWERFDLRAAPHASVRQYTDGFGNTAHLVTVAQPHELLEVTARGTVITMLSDPWASIPRSPWPLTPMELHDYLSPSRLVPLVPELELMAVPFRPKQPTDSIEAVRAMTDAVYGGFAYETQVTNVGTTVPEVLAARRGVCQDFAHVLIGLCRSLAIPARYVSGYLIVQHNGEDTPREHGARVASHAWVEAYTPTHGWRGFDPTNNLLAGEDHVKMAIGRDYSDVPPTRGTARGGGDERLRVEVQVERLD